MVKLEKYTTTQISALPNTSGRLLYDTDTNKVKYLDGVNNLLPTPSQLDLGGQIPPIAPQFFNNSTAQKLPYTLNQPQ